MQIDRPITIALILFIILLLIFFLVAPEYNTFLSLQTQIAEKNAEYKSQFAYYGAIVKTYDDLQNHKKEISKIDDALPQNPSFAQTVYFLQKTAQQNGLVVKNLSLSKSSSNEMGNSYAGSVKDIGFTMDLLGGYTSLQSFIVSLEKSSRLFEVTNISFGTSAGSPYTFSLQIKAHSY